MVFSSLTFLYLFLPACMLVYYMAPTVTARNWVLVLFSLLFYAWGEPVNVLLLLFSTACNYGFGLLLGRGGGKKRLMTIATIFNLGLLGFFKYTGFLMENINLLGFDFPVPQTALPIGISFYTFQALSYVIDVYRGEVKVQRSYLRFLLYVSLFPQLIAGPIVRYSELEERLAERRTVPRAAFNGATRFCVGLGKKVLVANYAGELASKLLDGDLASQTALGGWLGILFFTFQLYFDFSGYSDMAIGLGRIFGFRYAENFNLPYCSRSITEFWRRWHISLGSFFRDYVYIPLGGNRKRQILNLLVVWSLTGLWHGASWNFVLWGLYFFILLYIEKQLGSRLSRIPSALRIASTFLLVVLGWTLFYFTDLGRMGGFFKVLVGLGAGLSNEQTNIILLNSLPLLLLCILGSTPVPRTIGIIFTNLFTGRGRSLGRQRVYAGVAFTFDLLLLALCTVSLIGSTLNAFLYFRF
ncbi:MAG: MBOAT family protein [Oscillospiraceae bacterium]|nr:MBOAT family protein [Oscillospiraceae bacterium]